jgi:hypothetical protein
MANWNKAYRAAAAHAAERQRGVKAQREMRRFIDAHEKAVASLLAAFAEGLIDDATFAREMREEKKALTSELRASKVIPRAAIAAAATSLFTSLDDTVRAEGA